MFGRSFLFLVIFVIFDSVCGQCNDTTRPVVYTATGYPQYLRSPNYPDPYEHYANCAWRISAPVGQRIIVNVQFVNVEGTSSPCKYDYLQIYDGNDDTATELAKICWANRNSNNEFVSSTEDLYFTFTTDYAVSYDGFEMLFFTQDASMQADCSGATDLTATGTTQYIMSPNLPDTYSPNFTCAISIYPATQFFAVSIQMIFMDLESTKGCSKDVLKIYGLDDAGAGTEFFSGCTTALEWEFSSFPIESTGVKTQVNFTSDETTNRLGFYFSYTEIFKGINLTHPEQGSSVGLSFPEIQGTGTLHPYVFYLELSHTGTLSVLLEPEYTLSSDRNASIQDNVNIFSYTEATNATTNLKYLYLDLAGSFDYETIDFYSVVVKLTDSDVPQLTFSATFNITVTDFDDEAPVFDNLPNNITINRGKKTGDIIYQVNATDSDLTANFTEVLFGLVTDSNEFLIDNSTGEISLALDAKTLPLTTDTLYLTIFASSAASHPYLTSTSTFTISIDPDMPPECSHTTVQTEALDVNIHGKGHVIPYLDTWNCSDDYVNISYGIASVQPILTDPLFTIDNTTGELSMLRAFDISEIPSRQFQVVIEAMDSVTQTTEINVILNVTALTCYPNPRRLSVRMDQTLGESVMDDFNCTRKYGLTYTVKQYPPGTFQLREDVNGSAKIYLVLPVLKIKFYSLKVTISDGVEDVEMVFQVVIQTKRCGISGATRTGDLSGMRLLVQIGMIVIAICTEMF